MTGRQRPVVDDLVAYRPGRSAMQVPNGSDDALPLASNENQAPPLEAVQSAVSRAAAEINRYPDHLSFAVRDAIGTWLGLEASRIAVGCGSVGLLQQIWLAYVDRDDEVVFPWPSFEVYPIYTRLMNGVAICPSLRDHAIDVDSTVAACTSSTKLLLLGSPNNPTGTALNVQVIQEVLDNVSSETMVVLDEAYREYMNSEFGDPVPKLLKEYDNLVVLRTFSKAYGLAGLRVGYALADPLVVSAINRCLIPFSVSRVAQAAAVAAIDNRNEAAVRAGEVRRERERVQQELRSAGWDVTPSQGNFVFLTLGASTESIYHALERRGILTRPFNDIGLRVTIGTPAQNDRFLSALTEGD